MKNPIKFFHVKRTDNKTNKTGVVTIASMVVGTGKRAKVQIGASFCSPMDQFNKKIGRANALERMAKPETCLRAPFTGHSAETIENCWDEIDKPRFWDRTKLVNVENQGLTALPKLR